MNGEILTPVEVSTRTGTNNMQKLLEQLLADMIADRKVIYPYIPKTNEEALVLLRRI